MRDNDLDKRLESYQAPEPSDLLKARILKQAAKHAPAELAKPVPSNSKSWPRRYMAIAASLLAVFVIGVAGLQLSQPDASEDVWLEAANDLGVSEIYAWVEGPDSK